MPDDPGTNTYYTSKDDKIWSHLSRRFFLFAELLLRSFLPPDTRTMHSVSSSTVDSIEAIKSSRTCNAASHAPNVRRTTGGTSLKDYIDTVFKLPPEYSVPPITELVTSGLRSYVTFTGARLVIHPLYNGSYSLNHLARQWMNQGTKLRESTAPLLPIRLQQLSLKREFRKLYEDSTRAVKQSCIAWLPAAFRDFRLGCGCCMRDPLWCVPMEMRCDDALYFRQEVWRECFGNEGLYEKDEEDPNSRVRSRFGSMGWRQDGEWEERWLCKEKMLEDAVRGVTNDQESRSDTDEDWEDVEKVG